MTPRTACTATGAVLLKELGGEYLPKESILDDNGFFRVQRKHSTLPQLIENKLLSEKEADGLLKFTSVRNPYDSLVSQYVKNRMKYQSLLEDKDSWVHKIPNYIDDMEYCRTHSFDSWVLHTHGRKVLKRLLGYRSVSMFDGYTEGVDEIMRFENLQESFQSIMQKAGVKTGLTVPLINPTSDRKSSDYRSYYSTFSRQLMKFAYGQDLKRYGYEF